MIVSLSFCHRIRCLWFGILLGVLWLPHVRAEPALIFGLLPSESVATEFRRYAPLRDYLQQRLGRAVVLETARNFREFRRRTLAGRYDFLETAPHFVPEAVDSGQYMVITTIVRPLTAEIVVHADSPFQQPADLAGAVVATPSPSAIITRLGKETLIAAGLPGHRAEETPLPHTSIVGAMGVQKEKPSTGGDAGLDGAARRFGERLPESLVGNDGPIDLVSGHGPGKFFGLQSNEHRIAGGDPAVAGGTGGPLPHGEHQRTSSRQNLQGGDLQRSSIDGHPQLIAFRRGPGADPNRLGPPAVASRRRGRTRPATIQ